MTASRHADSGKSSNPLVYLQTSEYPGPIHRCHHAIDQRHHQVNSHREKHQAVAILQVRILKQRTEGPHCCHGILIAYKSMSIYPTTCVLTHGCRNRERSACLSFVCVYHFGEQLISSHRGLKFALVCFNLSSIRKSTKRRSNPIPEYKNNVQLPSPCRIFRQFWNPEEL